MLKKYTIGVGVLLTAAFCSQQVLAANLLPQDFIDLNADPVIAQCGFENGVQNMEKALAAAQLENMEKTGRKSIVLPLSTKGTFSVEIPYSSTWKARGKQVLPYTKFENGYGVGRIVLIDETVQDTACELGRSYVIHTKKGTLQQLVKDTQAQWVSNEQEREGETLPAIFMTLGGKKAAVLPAVLVNSGGKTMYYSALGVEVRGNVVIIEDPSSYLSAHINADMLRMAASIK